MGENPKAILHKVQKVLPSLHSKLICCVPIRLLSILNSIL